MFLCACAGTTSRDNGSSQVENIGKAENSIDSIVLKNVNGYYNSIHFSHAGDKLRIQYVSSKKDKIYYADENGKIQDSAAVPKLIRSENFDFFINDDKTAYFLINEKNIIYECVDSVMKEKYLYEYAGTQTVLSSMFVRFEVINNTALLGKITNYRIFIPTERAEYFKADKLGIFSLSNGRVVEEKSFFRYPQVYSERYFNELFPVLCRITKDSIACVFSPFDSLFIENINNQKEHSFKIKNIAPNNLGNYNLDSIQFMSYSHMYELENNKFLKIMMDDVSKNIAIIQVLKVKHSDMSGGTIPLYEDKPVVINIMDAAFAVKTKKYFETQGKGMFYNCYYLNNKLYVPQFSNADSNIIHVYAAY